jgi:hypothetical protein
MSFLKPLDMAQIHNESKYFQTSAISQPTNFDKSLPVPVIETKNQKKRQRDGSELNDQHDCTCSRESNKSSQISGRVNSSFLAGKNAKPTVTNNTATHKIYPLSKKYKTAPQSLLSGTTQDELSVTVNPTKETIGRSPLPSASGSTLNTQHLAGPCRTTDSSSTCKVEGKLGTKSTQGLEESQSNDAQSKFHLLIIV